MPSKKLPAFMFYPGDWLKDANLRRCTHEEKGVWIDMICLAHDCEQRGIFASFASAWSIEEIALAIGGPPGNTERAIQSLIDKGVARVRESDGAIYCHRVVKDEQARQDVSEKRKQAGSKGGSKTQAKAKQTGKQKGGSSYSVSYSASANTPHSPPRGGVSSADIYAAYPRKVGKPTAIRAIDKAVQLIRSGNTRVKPAGVDVWPPPDPAAWLLGQVQAFAKTPKGQAGELCPHPATWFNQARYSDDPKEWQRQGDGDGGGQSPARLRSGEYDGM